MAKFEIGEIAIIQSVSNPWLNGQETEILEILTRAAGGYRCTIEPERTTMRNGWAESALRKKKPPKEELSTWESIQKLTDWSPKKVSA